MITILRPLCSCARRELVEDTDALLSLSRKVAFTVEGNALFSAWLTRASVVTLPSLEEDGFFVSSTTGTTGSETSLFSAARFTKDGTFFSGPASWPMEEPAGGMHFVASNLEPVFSASGSTVSATNDTDVVCAYLENPSFGSVNTLSFEHIFARIGEMTVLADTGYALSDISITIVPATGGTYNIVEGSGHDDRTGWSSLVSGSPVSLASVEGTNSPDLYLVPGRYPILLSWTAVKGGAPAEHFTDISAALTVSSGAISKYVITLGGTPNPVIASRVQLSVNRASVTHDYLGSEDSFTVTSRLATSSGFEPSPWRTMIDIAGEWLPLTDVLSSPVYSSEYSWLSSYPTGNAAPAVLSETFTPDAPVNETTLHEEMLKSATILSAGGTLVDNSSSSAAVDLSMYDFVGRQMETTRYTANCYVVSSPGWYKFPLVYGNAIENSATNTLAYNSSTTGLGHLNGFKNYKFDLDISAPWIEDDWHTYLISKNHVASVGILWQQYSHYDEMSGNVVTSSGPQGVVDNLSVISGDDGRYIVFHIDSDNIRPGNFLICARDAGGDSSDEEGETGAIVMWSWHIWICPLPLDTVGISNGTDSFSALPVNVGWVDGSKGLYHGARTATLRFDSTVDPDIHSEEMTVTQEAGWDASLSGWGTYYQWGRKDPLVTGLFTYVGNNSVLMRTCIRNPNRLYSNSFTHNLTQNYYDWSTNNYENLWDSNWTSYGVFSSALPVSKTVVDPSPRRFCVAPDKAFDGFVSYGYEGSFADGYRFYTSAERAATVFFPATGYINYDGTLSAGETRYWTLHAWGATQRRASYSLRFTDASVVAEFYDFNHRASAQPIRPVRYN